MLFTSLLFADFKENHTLLWFKWSLQKIRETRNLKSTVFMNGIAEKWGQKKKTGQNSSLRRLRVYAQKSRLKLLFKNSISSLSGFGLDLDRYSAEGPDRDPYPHDKMKFLDIKLTKDTSILLHAIHSRFYWWILKKTILYSGFNNPVKKIRETGNLESIHEWHSGKMRAENQTKTRVLVYAQKPRLKMLFNNSISRHDTKWNLSKDRRGEARPAGVELCHFNGPGEGLAALVHVLGQQDLVVRVNPGLQQ